MAKVGGLGKGLDALFMDNDTTEAGSLMQIRVSDIEPNKDQPREVFDEVALNELADSIKEHGVLQPIVVRALLGGIYQIIAGERRWRASRIAGLSEIPAIVIEADDQKVMELALIENLQRQNLNIIEEAQGYKALMDSCGLTQEEVSRRVGKSRPVVANALRILSLPDEVLKVVEDGKISAGHARVLAGITDDDKLEFLVNETISKGLSVRSLEQLAKQEYNKKPKPTPPENSWGDSWYKEAEISLKNELNTNIKISHKGDIGSLQIHFNSREELERYIKMLSASNI